MILLTLELQKEVMNVNKRGVLAAKNIENIYPTVISYVKNMLCEALTKV